MTEGLIVSRGNVVDADTLQKMWTRDMALFTAQWLQDGLKGKFEEAFGKGYADWPASSNGLTLTYYAPAKAMREVRDAVMRTFQQDPEWYPRESRKYVQGIDATKRILREMRKKLEEKEKIVDLDEAALHVLKARYYALFPVLRLSLVLPGIWEQDLRNTLGYEAEKIIQKAGEDRLYAEGVFEAIDTMVRALAARKLQQMKRQEKLATFLSDEDLEKLAAGKELDWRTVEERSKGYVFCRGKVTASVDVERIFRENGYYYEEEKAIGNAWKGTPAFNGGIVEGKVRLVFAIEQLKEFKAGEILVSPMTVPDFIPVIKKASAIVTDEGGMMSHAAIAAREFQKPCVVGTRTITKGVNDGDVLLVDSEKGVVRKL